MASQGASPSMVSLRSKIEEEHLTCTICYELFKHPKALPCLHTFCYECLRDYVCSRGYEMAGKFPCPVCRSEIDIPYTGISGIQDNYTIQSLIETINRSRKGPQVPPRPSLSPIPQIPDGPSTENSGVLPSNDAQSQGGSLFTKAGGEVVYPQAEPTYPQSEIKPQYGTDTYPKGYPLYPTVPGESSTIQQHETERLACGEGLLVRVGKYGPTLTDFHKPYGLAIGRNNEFVVSDMGGNRILVFSHTGEVLARFGCECKISGIAITPANTILVAVDFDSEIMRLYNFDGKLLERHGQYYKFEKPSGIAISRAGHIAISNLEGHSVYVFTEQKKFSLKFGWKGAGDNHFNYPQFLKTNNKDKIVVSDSGNNCVKVFTAKGVFKRKFGQHGEAHGEFFCPMGIAIDSHNNIIVADSGNYRVEIFTSKGVHLKCLVKDTDEIGEEVKPLNVAVTKQDDIAVLFRGPQFAEVRLYHWRPPQMYS